VKRVAIIGGGFAGLAAGAVLAERGLAVTVLEARPFLGGRARSFVDEASGTTVDNGQHAMMGCYVETFRFLRRIAADAKVVRQPNLRVDLVDPRRGRGVLASPAIPGPFHMLSAVLGYGLLSRRERLMALWGGSRLLHLRRRQDPRLQQWTVTELLRALGQSANACASFWHPVAIATLNEMPDQAAAAPFAEVLARAFFGSRRDSQFVLPAVGLSDLYTGDAQRFVEARGGHVQTHAIVRGFRYRDDRLIGLSLREGDEIVADACVVAVPPRAAGALLPGDGGGLAEFGSSPIVSAHLWYDRPVLDRPMLGLIGTTTQWLFDRTALTGERSAEGGHCVSAVISADRRVADWSVDRVAEAIAADVRAVLPAARTAICQRTVVVKEKYATIANTPAVDRQRPSATTAIPNLFLAGDWTATGLPPTIEGAVQSGHRAADLVTAHLAA
jgi:hydroxysqualene dehydroxylase